MSACHPEGPPIPGGPPIPQGGPQQGPPSGQRKKKHSSLGLTRDTRYTVEQVLDARTLRHIKFVVRAAGIKKIFGAISCGKEANVYFALGEKQQEQQQQQQQGVEASLVPFALKVYRTSILSFRDRSKYVQGDFRFNHAYSRNRNPRKMVSVWALKEKRNLLRLHGAEIACPLPVALKGNVLLMDFIGTVTYGRRQQQQQQQQLAACAAAQRDDGLTAGCSAEPKIEETKEAEETEETKETEEAEEETEEETEEGTGETEEETDPEGSSKPPSAEELWGGGEFSFPFDVSLLSYSAAPRLKDLCRLLRGFAAAAQRCCCCCCSNCSWGSVEEQAAAGWRYLYTQMVLLLRCLFQRCRTVHGDFSEFNLLYFKGELVLIDVSQAVERDHPQALDFIKRDCKNATAFFSKRIAACTSSSSSSSSSSSGGCCCAGNCKETREAWASFPPKFAKNSSFFSPFSLLSVRQLFEFVVAADVPQELKHLIQQQQQQQQQQQGLCEALGRYLASRSGSAGESQAPEADSEEEEGCSSDSSSGSRSSSSRSSAADQQVQDAIFLQSWIPSSLHDVADLAALDRWTAGKPLPQDEALLNIHKLVNEPAKHRSSNSSSSCCCCCSDSCSSGSASSGDEGDSREQQANAREGRRQGRRGKAEKKGGELFNGIIPEGVDRKEWKKHVKEMNRERRQHKIPKNLKKKFRRKAANR